MRSPFIELALETDPALFDEFVAIMSMMGFEGFWEEGTMLKCYIPADLWSPGLKDSLQSSLEPIARTHHTAFPPIVQSVVADRDWNEEWESSLKPVHVTDRIVITPSWHRAGLEREKPDRIIITIDPKMSFGTGYHETTRLMLRLLQHHLSAGDVVLDVGTGTGVLAIAAVKLGAARAVGLDNDEWATANALENVRVNGVGGEIRIIQGELSAVAERNFSVIAANIQRNVIELLLPEMVDRLAPHGLLLLSGLLLPDRLAILNSLAASHITVLEEVTENEWLALAANITRAPG